MSCPIETRRLNMIRAERENSSTSPRRKWICSGNPRTEDCLNPQRAARQRRSHFPTPYLGFPI